MESQVREWAVVYSKLYVVTGPIFKDNIGAIGENKVTVPGYYYKIIFDGKNRMIGLVLKNASSSKSLDQFVVKVDDIEQRTGIDFFSGLDDILENKLKGSISNDWNFQ